MAHEGYHEPYEKLSEGTRDLHRAIISLIEELEAVDWYQQRADVCADPKLRAILLHHRDEEIEHALMNLEWIRRHDEVFDRNARTYLFSTGDITEVEEEAKGSAYAEASGVAPASDDGARRGIGGPGRSLGIGSLKG